MIDFVVTAVVLLIVGLATSYIVREKKKGVKCIGCPDGATCGHACGGASGCSGNCGGNGTCNGNCHAE